MSADIQKAKNKFITKKKIIKIADAKITCLMPCPFEIVIEDYWRIYEKGSGSGQDNNKNSPILKHIEETGHRSFKILMWVRDSFI